MPPNKFAPSPAKVESKQPTVRKADAAPAPTAGVAASFGQRLTTKVWIFLNHTGDDAGSTSEIKSEIYFDDAHVATGYLEVSNNTDFSADNGGLGKFLLYKDAIQRGVGKRFRATAFEEGNITVGDRYFVDGTFDFDAGPDEWMDGNVHTVGPYYNTSDGNFKGFIQFQVVPT
ncbi:hypothetical protein PV08_09716 [Exophiala spinifera]|uniref:Uncharacterized protein n=1 Tax=Exophiala spinifera TaxID=91928 RepID=A0A0D2BMS6_9EURO|nr:uncharacterized protein PV08_09716 [Exophiala spinifera]KIW12439.1 hypothetical protein PV08_09716 [Exophiala spinifera]